MEIEKMCDCGDLESEHYNNDEACFISECRCKKFEEVNLMEEKMETQSDEINLEEHE